MLQIGREHEKIKMNNSPQKRGFGGLEVACWPFGTHIRGFKPGRSRRIFQGKKILSTPSFGREVEPFAPCHIYGM